MLVVCSAQRRLERASQRVAIRSATSIGAVCNVIYRYALKTRPNTNRCRHCLCARTKTSLACFHLVNAAKAAYDNDYTCHIVARIGLQLQHTQRKETLVKVGCCCDRRRRAYQIANAYPLRQTFFQNVEWFPRNFGNGLGPVLHGHHNRLLWGWSLKNKDPVSIFCPVHNRQGINCLQCLFVMVIASISCNSALGFWRFDNQVSDRMTDWPDGHLTYQ